MIGIGFEAQAVPAARGAPVFLLLLQTPCR